MPDRDVTMNSSLVSLDDIIFIVPKLVESLNVTLTIAFYSLVFGLLVGAFFDQHAK